MCSILSYASFVCERLSGMRESQQGLFLHACGVLALFLEAFDHNESILFPPVGIGSEAQWAKF